MSSPLGEAAARAVFGVLQDAPVGDAGFDIDPALRAEAEGVAEAVLDVFVREATTRVEALRWPNGYATPGRVVADVLAALAGMRGGVAGGA